MLVSDIITNVLIHLLHSSTIFNIASLTVNEVFSTRSTCLDHLGPLVDSDGQLIYLDEEEGVGEEEEGGRDPHHVDEDQRRGHR